MAKTQKPSFKHLPLSAKVLISLSLVMSAAALFAIFSFISTYQSTSKRTAERELGQLVRNGQLGSGSEPVVAPEQERLYFYEADIYVPLTNKGNDLRYNYFEFSDSETDKITADMQIVSVPALYTLDYSNNKPICWQLANVSFNQKNNASGFPPEVTVDLADGRTMYVYPNRSKNCSSEAYMRGGLSPETVVELFKQAKSY